MTYLQLINNVLTRLREDPVTAEQVDNNFGTDTYYRTIGSHVNDAKDRVEDAWQWGALRGSDSFFLNPDLNTSPDPIYELYPLPGSADNHYIIKAFYVSNTGTGVDISAYRPVRQVFRPQMVDRYEAGLDAIAPGSPKEVAVMREDQDTGDILVAVYPPSPLGSSEIMIVDRVRHQDPLVLSDTRLFVPSLPVYTLATALASRERGEVGGTPTSELFKIADSHLSDAIAQDSTMYANELDWFSANDGWINTNLRGH